MVIVPESQDALQDLRNQTRDLCREHGVGGGRGHDAVLVVSELLGNAVRYGQRPVTCAVLVDGDDLLIEVEDANPDGPAPVNAVDAGAEGGRGLHLVAAVSRRWGWTPTAAGKRVWARV
jgi:anti-sigma regulatory factor (Ser/Thr protein kinase)